MEDASINKRIKFRIYINDESGYTGKRYGIYEAIKNRMNGYAELAISRKDKMVYGEGKLYWLIPLFLKLKNIFGEKIHIEYSEGDENVGQSLESIGTQSGLPSQYTKNPA